jgi:hypothetical protein
LQALELDVQAVFGGVFKRRALPVFRAAGIAAQVPISRRLIAACLHSSGKVDIVQAHSILAG